MRIRTMLPIVTMLCGQSAMAAIPASLLSQSALDGCTDDLAKSRGVDLVEMRRQRSAPEPANDVGQWFRSGDHPDKQERRGTGGLVSIRLIVGVGGAVRKCEIPQSGGDRAFEDLTCQLAVERARFHPAIGGIAGRSH